MLQVATNSFALAAYDTVWNTNIGGIDFGKLKEGLYFHHLAFSTCLAFVAMADLS